MFYDIFLELCLANGEKPGPAAEACGINRSNVSLWKSKGYTPRGEALNSIADHFGVSVDYLLGKSSLKEKQPDSTIENQTVKDELIAFYGDVKADLTPDDIDDLMVAMRAKAERNKKKKSGV